MNSKPGIYHRSGNPDDESLLLTLEKAAFGERRWPNNSIASCLHQRFVTVIFAGMDTLSDDPPTGFLVWRQIADEAEIISLGVTPSTQRGGIARYLLRELETQCRAKRLRRILLDVAATNIAALALYRGAGYQAIAERKTYYRDGTNALVMALGLSGEP